MTRTRLEWADTAKAIGIFLVFFGHFIERAGFAGNELLLQLYRHIYAFHMPFFFLLAGFFFRKKPISYGWLFLEKVKTRLVPVIFFVMICLPLWMHPEWWGMTDVIPEHELQKVWLLLHGKPVANWPCWFLVCLFSVELIASELIPFLHDRSRLIFALPVIYGAAWLATDNLQRKAAYIGTVENWWFLQEGVMALFFYLCGYFLSRWGGKLLPNSRASSSVATAVFFVVLIIAQTYVFPDKRSSVNMSASTHGNWLWFPIAAFAGSLMVMHLANLIPTNRTIKFVGQNTLPLVGFSGIFLAFLNPLIWGSVMPKDKETSSILLMLMCAGVSISSIAVCLPFIGLLNRYLPWLVGVNRMEK